jgi:hypothetical protein
MLRQVEALVQFDRVMCSDGYDRALDYVARNVNCPEAWLSRESFPAGETFWGWQVPSTVKHWRDGRPDPTIAIPNHRPMNLLQVQIPGTSEREMLFVTHLCHPLPSANDNASGPAMMMELIAYYAEHPPYFTLRFLFTVEYWGTVAFCQRHESALAGIIAGVSIDMVGADQDLCGSTMVVDEIPDHLASCFDLVLWDSLQTASRAGRYREIGNPVTAFRCDFQYFTGGSDHYILNDSSVGIPSTAVGGYPDRFYHTPDDTSDKISQDTLNLLFSTIVAGVDAFSDPSDVGDHRRSQLVLHWYEGLANRCVLGISRAGISSEEQMFRLGHGYRHALARLTSVGTSHSTPHSAPWLEIIEKRFEQAQKQFTLLTGAAFESHDFMERDRCVKLFKGPLSRNSLYERLTPEDKSQISGWLEQDSLFFHKLDAALNYSECRGVREIAWLLRLHYGGDSCQPILESAFELLGRHGLVEVRVA